MKRYLFIPLAAMISLFLLSPTADAQRGARQGGSGGWGPGGGYSRLYNAQTAETFSGEVMKVEHFTPLKGMRHGIHILVKTDKETIPVHLGPVWFIVKQEPQVAKGDKVEIKGSRITFNGKPAVIAATVKIGNAMLMLRDDNGVPRWAGAGRGAK